MPALKHTHSYVRMKEYGRKDKRTKSGELVFKCNDPRCTSFAPRSMVLGKMSLCPSCGVNEFKLDHDALARVTPKCPACRNTKEGKQIQAARNIVQELLQQKEKEILEELSAGGAD